MIFQCLPAILAVAAIYVVLLLLLSGLVYLFLPLVPVAVGAAIGFWARRAARVSDGKTPE
jgi:hypothetical protein